MGVVVRNGCRPAGANALCTVDEHRGNDRHVPANRCAKCHTLCAFSQSLQANDHEKLRPIFNLQTETRMAL
jgi:hypothetical protein